MFATLRISVKQRERYLTRRGEVLVEMKREKLSEEFETLFEASELADELVEGCDEETLAEFNASLPPLLTHQYPVSTTVDPAVKEAFQNFGSLHPSEQQCLSPFLIGACALDDIQLIAEGMSLIAQQKLDADDPAVSLEEVEGVVEVLCAYRGETACAPGFAAPTLVRDSCAALANIARLDHSYTKAVGSSGGVDLFLDWLKHCTEGGDKYDEHTVAPVCEVLSEVCCDEDHLKEFLEKDGLAQIVQVLSTDGTSPKRLENALQVICVLCQSENADAHKQVLKAGVIKLLLKVMGGHKTQNSAVVHVRSGDALLYLLHNDRKGKHRKEMVANDIVETLLTCLMPRVTTPESAEVVGALLTELIRTAPERDDVADKILDGLSKIEFVFAEFPYKPTTITQYMAVVASLCVSKRHKEAIVDAELIENVVMSMMDHPEEVRLQEQACRTLCEVTRGEDNEEVKDYMADVLEDSFHHGFNLIELIVEAIKNFVDDLDFVEAACSASWSVAYKNAKMKTKAAEAGVFDILSKVIEFHKHEPDVLPHCFGAISNLCANHEPNQLTAGTSGVIAECIDCLQMYKEYPDMCITILTTLKSIMVNQDDNMDKYEDAKGTDLVAEVAAIFEDGREEVDKGITKVTDFLTKLIDNRNDIIEAKRKKAEAGRIPMCEFLEEQDHALKALSDDEKSKVVKKGMLMAQHKGEKIPSLNLCVLTRHEITFYDDPEVSKTLTPLHEYQIPLFLSLSEGAFPLEFETMNKIGASLTAFTESEAEQWHTALSELQPERSTAVQVVDDKKKLPRTIAWQGDVFYIFMGKPGKMVIRRAFAAKDLSEISWAGEENEKVFSLKEAAHGDVWTFECKDGEEAKGWAEFVQEQVDAKLAELAALSDASDARAADKEQQDKDELARKEKAEAEEAWFDEEADRRLLLLMASDEGLDDDIEIEEYERMEKAAKEEADRRAEQERLRSERAADIQKKNQEREDAKKSQKDLRAYIDRLKKELAEENEKLDALKEENAPLAKQVADEKSARQSAERDYIDMKKEFDKLLGGRLGAVLEGYDFDAMERNKAEAEADMEEQQALLKKEQAMHDDRRGAAAGRDALDGVRSQIAAEGKDWR